MPQLERQRPHSSDDSLSEQSVGDGGISRGASQRLQRGTATDSSLLGQLKYDISRKTVSLSLDGYRPDGTKGPPVTFSIQAHRSSKGTVEFSIRYHETDDRVLGAVLPDKKGGKDFSITLTGRTDEDLKRARDYFLKTASSFRVKASPEELTEVFSFGIARTAGLAQLEEVKASERSLFSENPDLARLNRSPPGGIRGSAAQEMPGYNCMSFVRSVSAAFHTRPLLLVGTFGSVETASELYGHLTTIASNNRGRIEHFEGRGQPSFAGRFVRWNPQTENFSTAVRSTCDNLKPGDIVFLQNPEHRNPSSQQRPSHIGIVIEGRNGGGFLGWGGHNPRVAHIIGDQVYIDEVREIAPDGLRWMGVNGQWKIAGVLAPDSVASTASGGAIPRAFPNGIGNHREQFADVSFVKLARGGPQVDLPISAVARYLSENCPSLRGISVTHIANILITLNPDRVAPPSNLANTIDYTVKDLLPLQMPRSWAESIKGSLLKGIASSYSTSIVLREPPRRQRR